MERKKKLLEIYYKLFKKFGPQCWWPADSKFEVVVGAILTQNTNWANVRKAIDNLKKAQVLNPQALHRLNIRRLASLIKPSGYFNIKAHRLKEFINILFSQYQGRIDRLFSLPLKDLRKRLLEIKGIGPETADSIILYAAGMPVFVVDAYTKRIFTRHKLIDKKYNYHDIQTFFMSNLDHDSYLFNEYHALLVRVGKDFCKKAKADCNHCPLESLKLK